MQEKGTPRSQVFINPDKVVRASGLQLKNFISRLYYGVSKGFMKAFKAQQNTVKKKLIFSLRPGL